MYIVNAFKRTKSICQHKSFISSAVFSNSSFTISLLHHWEYTERTQGSLILLTRALVSIIMQFPYTVFLYYSSLGSNKPGSQRTHLWLAERLSCTAWFSNKGSSLLPLPKELSRGKMEILSTYVSQPRNSDADNMSNMSCSKKYWRYFFVTNFSSDTLHKITTNILLIPTMHSCWRLSFSKWHIILPF